MIMSAADNGKQGRQATISPHLSLYIYISTYCSNRGKGVDLDLYIPSPCHCCSPTGCEREYVRRRLRALLLCVCIPTVSCGCQIPSRRRYIGHTKGHRQGHSQGPTEAFPNYTHSTVTASGSNLAFIVSMSTFE